MKKTAIIVMAAIVIIAMIIGIVMYNKKKAQTRASQQELAATAKMKLDAQQAAHEEAISIAAKKIGNLPIHIPGT